MLEKLKKIGDDVILVRLEIKNQNIQNYGNRYEFEKDRKRGGLKYNYEINEQNKKFNYYNKNEKVVKLNQNSNIGQSQSNYKSYVRFKPINNMKYK